MRKIKLVGVLASIVVGATAIVGCGGGAGGDGGTKAVLDAKAINDLGQSAGTNIPGCIYSSDISGISMMDDELALSYKSTLRRLKERSTLPVKMEREVNEQEQGDCGGSIQKTGTHADGSSHLSYVYNDYCTTVGNGNTKMNGEMTVDIDGTPSDNGPIINYTSYTTGSAGVTVKTSSGTETKTQTMYLNKLIVKDTSIEGTEVKFVDSSGSVYRVTGLKATMKDDKLQLDSATYNDPKLGAMTVTSTPMGTDGSGTITVTGSEGSANFKNDGSGIFKVRDADGVLIGQLDCSSE